MGVIAWPAAGPGEAGGGVEGPGGGVAFGDLEEQPRRAPGGGRPAPRPDQPGAQPLPPGRRPHRQGQDLGLVGDRPQQDEAVRLLEGEDAGLAQQGLKGGGVPRRGEGLGVPMPIMEKLKKAGLKVMVVCGAVKHAVKAEQAGCDAVICQGGEGGGHTGLVGTMPLVAQAVEAVKVPVVAAGGLYDGRGLAAALSLGAVGVWMGTRFIASKEAHAGELYRETILEASDEDTIRTRSYSGKPMRVKKNPYVEDWEKRPQDIQPFPMQAMISHNAGVMGGIGGQIEGLDPDKSCFAMGQSAGGVREVLPAGEIVRRIMAEAEVAIDRVAALRERSKAPA